MFSGLNIFIVRAFRSKRERNRLHYVNYTKYCDELLPAKFIFWIKLNSVLVRASNYCQRVYLINAVPVFYESNVFLFPKLPRSIIVPSKLIACKLIIEHWHDGQLRVGSRDCLKVVRTHVSPYGSPRKQKVTCTEQSLITTTNVSGQKLFGLGQLFKETERIVYKNFKTKPVAS